MSKEQREQHALLKYGPVDLQLGQTRTALQRLNRQIVRRSPLVASVFDESSIAAGAALLESIYAGRVLYSVSHYDKVAYRSSDSGTHSGSASCMVGSWGLAFSDWFEGNAMWTICAIDGNSIVKEKEIPDVEFHRGFVVDVD